MAIRNATITKLVATFGEKPGISPLLDAGWRDISGEKEPVMSETSSTLQKIEQWEEAWADYIFALEMWESDIPGEDHVYWCGIAGRRLDEAKRQLRHLDPDFCKSLGGEVAR